MKRDYNHDMRSALAIGTLLHARRDNHANRTFRYPVYMADLDLAELPALDRSLRLFSHNRRNLFAIADRDYEAGSIDLAALRAANGLPVPATTRLVTNLKTCGYVFNPVSFFLDHDASGALISVIAEVNNTYGGRRRYVLGPAQRIGEVHGRVGFRHVRELFVSPFLHGDADYELWFDAPLGGDRIGISMHVDFPEREGEEPRARDLDDQGDFPELGRDEARARGLDKHGDFPGRDEARAREPDEPARNERRTRALIVEPGSRKRRSFVARFEATRRPFTDRGLAMAAVRYPLMAVQVISLIHLEAMRLRWRGAPYRRPGPDHRPLTSPSSILSRAER